MSVVMATAFLFATSMVTRYICLITTVIWRGVGGGGGGKGYLLWMNAKKKYPGRLKLHNLVSTNELDFELSQQRLLRKKPQKLDIPVAGRWQFYEAEILIYLLSLRGC